MIGMKSTSNCGRMSSFSSINMVGRKPINSCNSFVRMSSCLSKTSSCNSFGRMSSRLKSSDGISRRCSRNLINSASAAGGAAVERPVSSSQNTPLYIGLDVGTQGVKALCYNAETKEIVGRGAASFGLLPTNIKGRAEQHPSSWIKGCAEATQKAIEGLDPAARAQIRGVGVSGQQHGMVVLDSSKQVLRPAKLWCDVEAADEAAELSRAHGRTIVPSFTGAKLLWLKRHEPEVFARVRHVMLPHDYVNFWLTGRIVAEAGDASGTTYYDMYNKKWDPAAMALIDEKLHLWVPELIGSNDIVGTLTSEASSALGLPQDAIVSSGSGDNAMSALGVGCVDPGQMMLSLGTSGTLFAVTEVPLLDPSGAVCPFADATGKGLPLMCTLNCTMPPQEIASSFGMTHPQLTELAQQPENAQPGCGGVSFLPYLVGERTPNWPRATGALLGLTPGVLSRPGLLYRAALEGASFSLLAGLHRMLQLGREHGTPDHALLSPSELRLVGGGARNPLWQRIIADSFQLPIRLPVELETAALGGALQAAACHQGFDVAEYIRQNPTKLSEKIVRPDPSVQELYEAAFERHVSLGNTLFAGLHA
mmetsp:Transcript_15708/g.41397  ORF Transcript_15708/g.41397 Transcript_15708/m.41397 type:complete len:592 (-) Transcript_15708:105-1880(-)